MITLAQKYPELAAEWHPTENGILTPNDVSPHSGKKVWWQCQKGHPPWSAFINNRSRGSGCPYCSGRMLTEDTCLANRLPELATEWHPTSNESLTPNDVFISSDAIVWWKCQFGHEWQAAVCNRARGNNCPHCKIPEYEDCLAVLAPELAAEWHPTENKNLTPRHVSEFSHISVWWTCFKGHPAYESTVANRTNKKSGCPYCSGNQSTPETSLAAVYPKVAAEWHPTKNENLSPNTETPSAAKCVWWLCSRCGHEWKATVNNRVRGSGCRRCNQGKQSSGPELRIWAELAHVFGEQNVVSRYVDLGFELDIFIKPLNVGIEYDGYRWHANSHDSDARKHAAANRHGIFLIRVSEQPESPADRVFLAKTVTPALMRQIVLFLHNFDYANTDNVRRYADTTAFRGDALLAKQLAAQYPRNNISTLEAVCADFDYEQNYPFAPENLSKWSERVVWWKCCRCGKRWQAAVCNRARNKGCHCMSDGS